MANWLLSSPLRCLVESLAMAQYPLVLGPLWGGALCMLSACLLTALSKPDELFPDAFDDVADGAGLPAGDVCAMRGVAGNEVVRAECCPGEGCFPTGGL